MRTLYRLLLFFSLAALPVTAFSQSAAPLKVYSAGRLKAAWLDLAAAYELKAGVKVQNIGLAVC